MCLAIPGRILQMSGGVARVDFVGVRREIHLDLVEDAQVGDWVLAHAGFAIQKMDGEEASELLQMLSEAGILDGEGAP